MAAKKKKPTDFFVWLRSGLRSMSRRYPAIYESLARAKRPYKGPGPNKRQKVCYECAVCGGLFSGSEVAVDHRIDCGALKSWGDVQGFMERLFCSTEGLDVLCHADHDAKTYATKHNVSLEEAKIQKKILAFIKARTITQLKAYLTKHGFKDVSNSTQRRAAVEEIIRRENA